MHSASGGLRRLWESLEAAPSHPKPQALQAAVVPHAESMAGELRSLWHSLAKTPLHTMAVAHSHTQGSKGSLRRLWNSLGSNRQGVAAQTKHSNSGASGSKIGELRRLWQELEHSRPHSSAKNRHGELRRLWRSLAGGRARSAGQTRDQRADALAFAGHPQASDGSLARLWNLVEAPVGDAHAFEGGRTPSGVAQATKEEGAGEQAAGDLRSLAKPSDLEANGKDLTKVAVKGLRDMWHKLGAVGEVDGLQTRREQAKKGAAKLRLLWHLVQSRGASKASGSQNS